MNELPSLPSDMLIQLAGLPDDIGVSERHAAAILGLSVSKLQKDRVKGGGPKFVKNGKTKFARVTYRMADLRAYQRENTHQSTSAYLATSGALAELGLVRPFAVFSGVFRDFIESVSEDPDEIVWIGADEAVNLKGTPTP